MKEKTIKLSEKVVSSFHQSWKEYDNPKYLNIVEKGGRGSSKSTTITIKLVKNRMKYKSHALVCRKVGRTLRQSVRNQILWAIHHLEVQDAWKWSDSLTGDMTLEYKPTGAKIFFEGADGDKIKGWKTFDMPTTDIFFEEITDFKIEDELSSIKLSILRTQLPEGYKYTFFHAYNPPKRRSSWVNKKYETQFIPDNTYVHHSDYRDNPFLPNEFHIEAEICRTTNERRYRWEYLGEPIGNGIVPFENLVFREITDEEFKTFDNLRTGNDWGYAVDPNAFVVWHYDKTRRKIYAMHEIVKVKLSNDELANGVKAIGMQRERTKADSAEPKSIAKLKELGCNFVAAKKGKGSVESGEKWLDELDEIVIDPKRTPIIAKEFESIDYEVDRDGNTIARLVDKDNHTIDATRYAFEDDIVEKKGVGWKKKGV